MSVRISFALALAIAAAGCGNGGPQDAEQVPVFEEAPLASGRAVWIQVCRNCHLTGVAGAPALRDYAAWQPGLAIDCGDDGSGTGQTRDLWDQLRNAWVLAEA